MMSHEDPHYTEVSVYGYDDPTTKLDVLQNAVSPKFLEQINAQGAGQFTLSLLDEKLAAQANLLDFRNVIKLSCDGEVRSAFLLTGRQDDVIGSGEDSDKAATLSGSGLRQWFGDARVDPEGGLKQSSPDTRVFSWASTRGSWYNAADWKTPVRIERYHIAPDKTPDLQYTYNPAEWPDAPNAYWVWSQAYTYENVGGKRLAVTPDGNAYFRYEFTVAAADAGSYSLFAAADDTYVAFIDSALAIDGTSPIGTTHYHETVRYDFDLTAGPHVLAFRVTNRKRPPSNTRNPAALIAALFKAGDADSGVAAQLITTTGSTGWVVNGYPAKEPGWSVGEILLKLLAEAAARGVKFPNWVTPTFTAAVDSEGVPWADNLPFSFNVGDSLLDVLKSMEELAIEAWIDPDTYQFNVAQNRGSVKTVPTDTADAVVLREGWNLLSASIDSEADLTNSLLMKTDDGWLTTQPSDPTSRNKYGVLESSISTSVNSSLSKKLSDKVFEQKALAEVASTYTLVPRPGAEPFTDFDIGDWVLAPDATGNMVSRRVVSLAITVDNAGNPAYAVEFDTVFQTKEEEYDRMAKLISGSGLGSGFTSGDGGGSGGTSPSTGTGTGYTPADPAAPSNLVVTSVGYFTPTGVAQARATFTWDPVSLDINGSPIKGVTKYEILGRRSTADVYQVLGTADGSATQLVIPGLPSNDDFFFVMRTFVTSTRASVVSDPPVEHLLALPVTKMTAPTNPKLSTNLGTVTATWDGKLSTGTRPAQFAYVYAEYATSQNGPWTQVGAISAQGGIVLTGFSVGSTIWVRLGAVDNTGRASDPSGAVSVVVAGVATADLQQQFQDSLAATTKAASDALVSAGTATTNAATALKAAQDAAAASGGVRVQAAEPTGADRKAGILWIKTPGYVPYTYNASNDTWVKSQDQALIDAAQAASDAKTLADSASKTATTAAGQAGQALTAANGKNTILYVPTQPNLSTSISGDTWFDTDDGNKMYNYDGSSWVAKPYGTSAIADLAITNAKISNLDAAKITTGFLAAGRIDSATITSRMLAVGDFKDYLDGSDFENPAAIPWTFPDANAVLDTSVKHNGTQSVRFATTGTFQTPPVTSVTTTMTNLVSNPSFENGLTGWTGMRAGLTSQVWAGGLAPGMGTTTMRVEGNTTTDSFAYLPVTLKPNTTYVMSGSVLNGSTMSGAHARARSLVIVGTVGGSAVVIAQSSQGSNANNGISRVTSTFTTPASLDATGATIRAYNGTATGGSNPVLWDGILLVETTATSVPYFDGDTPGTTTDDGTTKVVNSSAWSGAAHASTSVRTSVTSTTGTTPVQPTREYGTNYAVPVKAGQTYVMTGWVYTASQYNGDIRGAAIELRDGTTNAVLGTSSLGRAVVTGDNVWTKVSVSAVIPTGTTTIKGFIRLNHTRGLIYADDFSLKNGAGVLIEDGAITAPMLRADSVTANAIKAGAVQTEQLDAYAITSKHTITGALIQTAEDGARTVMDSAGLQVFNDAGTPLVQLGYGIETGMSIRNPTSGRLTPLAQMAFGAGFFSSAGRLNIATTPTENVWSAYTTDKFAGTWTSPSNRAMVLYQVLAGDQATSQNFKLGGTLDLIPASGSPAYIRLQADVWLTFTNGFYMGVMKTVVPGETYTCVNSVRSMRTPGGVGTPWIDDRSVLILPL